MGCPGILPGPCPGCCNKDGCMGEEGTAAEVAKCHKVECILSLPKCPQPRPKIIFPPPPTINPDNPYCTVTKCPNCCDTACVCGFHPIKSEDDMKECQHATCRNYLPPCPPRPNQYPHCKKDNAARSLQMMQDSFQQAMYMDTDGQI